MRMIVLGLRNLFRSKLRLAVVIILIAVPFFLLLVMKAIGDGIQSQTEVLKRDVNTLLQLRARGSMGHVNMVGQDRILPQDILGKVGQIEHVVHVEPYLLAMAPITEPNFVMHVGLDPSAAISEFSRRSSDLDSPRRDSVDRPALPGNRHLLRAGNL